MIDTWENEGGALGDLRPATCKYCGLKIGDLTRVELHAELQYHFRCLIRLVVLMAGDLFGELPDNPLGDMTEWMDLDV